MVCEHSLFTIHDHQSSLLIDIAYMQIHAKYGKIYILMLKCYIVFVNLIRPLATERATNLVPCEHTVHIVCTVSSARARPV